MDKTNINDLVINSLMEAGVISSEYSRGFSVFRKKGLDIIKKCFEIFQDLLSDEGYDVSQAPERYLVPKEEYYRMYNKMNNYSSEIIEYEDYIVISDQLINNLALLCSTTNNCVASMSTIYRKKKGTKPLFKESKISPVIQCDMIVDNIEVGSVINSLIKVYTNLFNNINIEISVVEAEIVSNYAKREIYFMCEHNDDVTVLGMIYLLDDQFKKNLGIENSKEVVNSGISGKTLYKSFEYWIDNDKRLIIPVAISSAEILVRNVRNNQDVLNKIKRNFVVSEENISYKKWKNSGIMFYIIIHDNITLYSSLKTYVFKLGEVEQLIMLVQNLLKKNKEILFGKLSKRNFSLLCSNCDVPKLYKVISEERCMSCNKKEVYLKQTARIY